MEIGSGLASNRDARTFGRYYLSLLIDNSWIRRRVETIQILDENQVDRAVTIDVDGRELRRRARAYGLRSLGHLPVPLETLEKALQLDLDVRDPRGNAVPVTTSDEDSKLAHAFLLATIEANGVPLRSLTARVKQELFNIVRTPSIERLDEIANRVLDPAYVPSTGFSIQMEAGDFECWASLLYVDDITATLIQVAGSYVFASQMRVPDETFILKFRYREELAGTRQFSLGTQLGFRAAPIKLQARGVGTAQREHLRVSVPDGATMTRARLAKDTIELPEGDYGLRQSAKRSVVYTRGLAKDESYRISVRMRPQLGSFFLPALGTTFFMTALMYCGWFLEESSFRFSGHPDSADASVAILALIPSVMAIYFARVGEHRLVGRLHFLPRILLLGAGLASVWVAASVAAEMSHAHIRLAFFAAFVFAAVLALYYGAVVITVLSSIAVARSKSPSFPTAQ